MISKKVSLKLKDMKIRTLAIQISMGIIFVFLIGFIKFLILDAWGAVRANGYIIHKTYRLAILTFQEPIFKCFIFTLLIPFFLVGLGRMVSRVFYKIYPKYKTIFNLFFIWAIGAMLFILLGWMINHYLIPFGKYHPVSLMADLVILFFSYYIGRKTFIFIRRKGENRCHLQGIGKYSLPIAAFLVLFLILINIGILVFAKIGTGQGPNILMVVIDALRQDHLGCYGYHRNTSPAIDKIAHGGVVFQNAFSSSPWTKPSVASLFTAMDPNNHKTLSHYDHLPEFPLTIAEALKNIGYRTYFFTAGNYNIDKKYQFNQGFDYFFNDRIDAKQLSDKLIKILPVLKKQKFFAYLHYMDTHLPYQSNKYNHFFNQEESLKKASLMPGKIFQNKIKQMEASNQLSLDDKEYLKALYDGQIRYVDEQINRILSLLRDNEILENTLIIITSDHGEEFWDHQNFEHGHTLYNELLKIPLIFRGYQLKASMVKNPVRLIDLFPTILKILKIKNKNILQNGNSFLNLLRGEIPDSIASKRQIFSMGALYGAEKYCLINKGRKIILNTDNKKEKGELIGFRNKNKIELYDIINDPQEKKDLSKIEPKTVTVLKKRLEQLLIPRSNIKSKKSKLDKKARERLKSLGYL